jgi:hypothetical protein
MNPFEPLYLRGDGVDKTERVCTPKEARNKFGLHSLCVAEIVDSIVFAPDLYPVCTRPTVPDHVCCRSAPHLYRRAVARQPKTGQWNIKDRQTGRCFSLRRSFGICSLCGQTPARSCRTRSDRQGLCPRSSDSTRLAPWIRGQDGQIAGFGANHDSTDGGTRAAAQSRHGTARLRYGERPHPRSPPA